MPRHDRGNGRRQRRRLHTRDDGEPPNGEQSRTTPVVPEDLKVLYKYQTDFVRDQIPALQNLTSDVMGGGNAGTNPYIKGLYSTIAAQGNRAANIARQQTPRGAAQDYAVASTNRDMAMERSRVENAQKEQVLQRLYTLFSGFNPASGIGQSVSKPQFSFDLGVGPFSYNTGA